MESASLNEIKDQSVEDTTAHVEEKIQTVKLDHGVEKTSEPVIENTVEQEHIDQNDRISIDVNSKIELSTKDRKPEHRFVEKAKEEGTEDAISSKKLSKAVVIGDAEEGELDYEEEVPEEEIADEEQKVHHDKDQSCPEDGEVVEEKEGIAEKEDEGSEEGEIVSDDDDGDKVISTKQDKEEGEVNDDDLEEGQLDEELDKGPRPRVLCKYYEAGTCRWGITCRFLHPGINDKGNYVMHRPVGMYPTAFGKPPPPSELGPLNNMVPRGPPMPIMQPTGFGDNAHLPVELEMLLPSQPRKETAWERGLKKAKEIKLTSIKRKEEDENFEEKRINLSIKENDTESERPVAVRREPWRHATERDGQAGARPRPVDLRPEINERRFSRSRKSPPRRYDGDRERGSRSYDKDREKFRDMDRERYLRMRRERTPPSHERRGREREREKPDFRREKRSDVREKIQRVPHEELPKEQAKVKIEQVKEEPKKGPIEETGQNVEVAVSPKMDAEQWVDPWMRRQPAQNRSPEIRSPVRKGDDLSSIGSSESGEDSDSEESDESGSDSDSDSGESSNAEEGNDAGKEVVESKPIAGQEPKEDAAVTGPKDPRIASAAPTSSITAKSGSVSSNDRSRSLSKPSRSGREYRDPNRKRHGDSHRLPRRGPEDDRRDRDRRDRYPPSALPPHAWQAQSSMEGSWPRIGFNQHPGNGYRGDDRPRRPDEGPRLKSDKYRGDRPQLSRSPRDLSNSRRRDPREGPREETDRRRADGYRTQSPKQRDPRLADTNRQRKRDEERRTKEENPADKKTPLESTKQPVPRADATADTKDEKTTKNNSEASEDEFRSPKYGAGSGSESESGSESGSESESESEAASDSDSGSASGTPSEKSGSESGEEGSGSGSGDKSDSSDSDASTSRRKEIERKKKDFEMVLNQTKSLSSSQKDSKSRTSSTSRETTDQRPQAGQKRPASGQESSTSSPKAALSKTSARKDELLKELKAIEDAIARKRAKIE